MRTRIAAPFIAAALLIPLAGCSSQPTQEEIAKSCVKALSARADGDKAKPKDCNGLSDDDYNTLLMSNVLTGGGFVDKNGNVNPDKLLGTDAP